MAGYRWRNGKSLADQRMRWRIVPYRTEHAESLRHVYRQARQVAFSWVDPALFQLADFDDVIQGETVLVAIQQENPVGFIAWWPPDNFVHSLFVSSEFSGKGIGKALLEACLAEIERPATLKCVVANQPALRFYQSMGWVPVEEGESPEGTYVLLRYNN